MNGSTRSKSVSSTSREPDPLDRAQRAVEDGRAATRELMDAGDWDEPTGRTEVTVNLRMQSQPEVEPSRPDGMVGVAHATVNKLPPSHLLIVVLVVALAAAAVGRHKLGLW